jgi:hypothetical protein
MVDPEKVMHIFLQPSPPAAHWSRQFEMVFAATARLGISTMELMRERDFIRNPLFPNTEKNGDPSRISFAKLLL